MAWEGVGSNRGGRRWGRVRVERGRVGSEASLCLVCMCACMCACVHVCGGVNVGMESM